MTDSTGRPPDEPAADGVGDEAGAGAADEEGGEVGVVVADDVAADVSPAAEAPDPDPAQGDPPADVSPAAEAPDPGHAPGDPPADVSPAAEAPDPGHAPGDPPADVSPAAEAPDPGQAPGDPPADVSPAAETPAPRRTRRPRTTAAPELATGPEGAGPEGGGHRAASTATAPGRPVALRLAGLHVRMGQLLLARSELEALAGRGALDETALLDLAEARWRTGDLAGAGEAAATLLAQGREEPLALLIAAESVAAQGRPGEARRLASRALAVAPLPLDAVFAGMPRNPIWPDDPAPAGDHAAATLDGSAAGGAVWSGHAARPRHASPAGEPAGPASVAAAEAFAGGRAALAGGDTGPAALRLGVALRLDPEFAEAVLAAVGAWDRDPALALVAGDALRLLGREAEAHVAFDLAGGTL